MTTCSRKRYVFGTILLAGLLAGSTQAGLRKPVTVEGKKLPLRVLARAFSNIYEQPDAKAKIVQENVPTFKSFYVYAMPSEAERDLGTEAGFYEVGNNNRGDVVGWMKASDVLIWRQAMCMTYRHPEGRESVLFFYEKDRLKTLAQKPGAQRESEVQTLYDTIAGARIPGDFPVVSKEPALAVDWKEQFYLIPILDSELTQIDERDARYLQVASATESRGKTELKEDRAFVASANKTADQSKTLQRLKMNIVYVMDLSNSMQPYVNIVRDSIQDFAEKVSKDEDIGGRVQFGFWGFRDHESIKGIEFNTKNYTPSLLDPAGFAEVMQTVEEAKVGSAGFDEDLFAGVDQAMSDTAWEEDAYRVIILIGDAPSHEMGHAWNSSGQDAHGLRAFATDAKTTIMPVHIIDEQDTRKKAYNALAEVQFSTLGMNPGVDRSSYLSLSLEDKSTFEAVTSAHLDYVQAILSMAGSRGGTVGDLSKAQAKRSKGTSPKAEAVQDATEKTREAMLAGLSTWIGREEQATAPRDVVGWCFDKDLTDPVTPSFDVRILVNKNQLDSLTTVLKELIGAAATSQLTSEDFFDALVSVSALGAIDPERIKTAQALSKTGLIPEFISDLPYTSLVMSMNNEVWRSYTEDQQAKFMQDLNGKVKFYQSIYNDPSSWIALNQGDDPSEHVYPINIERLP